MIGFAFLAALLAFQTPAPAATAPRAETISCAARTPAGDLLLLDIAAMGEKGVPPTLIIGPRPGSAWPEAKTGMLAVPTRLAGDEMEWAMGPYFVRIGRYAGARNLTIFSSRDGKLAQAVAFGFCDTAPLGPVAVESRAPAADVFKESRWQDGCFFVAPGLTLRTGRFLMDQTMEDKRLGVIFSPVEGDLWPRPVSARRELLEPAPRSEARGIILGAARFAAQEGQDGPRGMDLAFIDAQARRMSVVVRFNQFDQSARPGFAICGVPKIQEHRP
jgi:hypothetical protein